MDLNSSNSAPAALSFTWKGCLGIRRHEHGHCERLDALSAAYQRLDAPHFDYDLQRLPGVDGEFRGPAVDISKPYIACIGAAQTFGRFCLYPFPTLLSESLSIPTLNLAAGGAGPRYFLRAPFLLLANAAKLVVVQIMSARSEGNYLFDTSTTGTSTGVRQSDGEVMRFNRFYKELQSTEDSATIEHVLNVTRDNYVYHSVRLLESIRVPRVVLWFAQSAPDTKPAREYPQFVTADMVRRIVPFGDAYVECAGDEGMPQRLWQASKPIEGVGVEDGYLVNSYYPSPEMHLRAAQLLDPVCRSLLQTP